MSAKQIDYHEEIEKIKDHINEHGFKQLHVYTLCQSFGIKRRSENNIRILNDELREAGLYVFEPLSLSIPWKEKIQIYEFPHERLGDSFKTEKRLEQFINDHDVLSKLGICNFERQHSPCRTRDRFDFKGIDRKGNHVAIELKNKDGGNHAIQQVLRYMGQLKNDVDPKRVRGVLITEIRGYQTAYALHGINEKELKNFKWYVYNYDRRKKDMNFEEVTKSYIKKHLKRK